MTMCTQPTSDQHPIAPPIVDPHWPMGPEVIDLFAIIRAEVARTIAMLGQPMDRGER
jgi:hypothetical protein